MGKSFGGGRWCYDPTDCGVSCCSRRGHFRAGTVPTSGRWVCSSPVSEVSELQIAGMLVFVFDLLRSLVKGTAAGSDPWDAWTHEWSTTSPPPEYNFAKIPVVRSRRRLWDIKHPEG